MLCLQLWATQNLDRRRHQLVAAEYLTYRLDQRHLSAGITPKALCQSGHSAARLASAQAEEGAGSRRARRPAPRVANQSSRIGVEQAA